MSAQPEHGTWGRLSEEEIRADERAKVSAIVRNDERRRVLAVVQAVLRPSRSAMARIIHKLQQQDAARSSG